LKYMIHVKYVTVFL